MTPAVTALFVVGLWLAVRFRVFDDAVVHLVRGLESTFRFLARLTNNPRDAQTLIQWFEHEVHEMKAAGGSGVGTAILFLIVVGPSYSWRRRRSRRRARKQ